MIRGLFVTVLARLVSPLVSFLIIVLVARIWGKEILGQYNTVWVWFGLFHYASLFGIGEFIPKEVGANRADVAKYLTHGLFFVLLSSLLCGIIMAGGAVFYKYPGDVKYGIMIASLALPFYACTVVCHGIGFALEKIKYVSLAWILENLLFLLFGSIIIFKGYGLINLIWCLVISRLLSSVFNLFTVYKFTGPWCLKIEREFFWKILTSLAIFGVTGIGYAVFMRVDVIMLSKMADMVSVGLYSSVSKLTEICLIVPTMFYFLNLPIAARDYKSFQGTMHQKVEANAKQVFIIIILIFGLGFFFAESILGIIFGKTFVEASWILKIMMLAFLIQSAEMVLTMSCQASGHHKAAMYFSIGRAVTNVALNFIFIPAWGALGAAMATLFSISLSFAALQYFVKKNLGSFQWIRVVKKPALVCLFIMILLSPLSNYMNILLLGFVFILGYGFILLALNGFSLKHVKGL